MKHNSRNLTHAAIIAALYVILTMVSRLFNLDSSVIQVRFSEALCILPCFTPAAIPGLFIGCLLSNIFSGALIWDVVFGSIATLIGALFTRKFKSNLYLAVLPPILTNTLIIPFILAYGYGINGGIPYFMLTICLGEIISCGILGSLLFEAVKKAKLFS